MPSKPKLPQPSTPGEMQMRDMFESPRYATELILPFIPICNYIWESCAGQGRMSRVLSDTGRYVFKTDIQDGPEFDCLTYSPSANWDCMITNPPYSLKRKIWDRFVEINRPFALLVPCDYSGWIIKAIDEQGAEKVIPKRRIDYLTPNILTNIHKGETLAEVNRKLGKKYKRWFDIPEILRQEYTDKKFHLYDTVEAAGNKMLAKHSTSQFHSMFLCYKFGIGRTETFVPLSIQDKLNIL